MKYGSILVVAVIFASIAAPLFASCGEADRFADCAVGKDPSAGPFALGNNSGAVAAGWEIETPINDALLSVPVDISFSGEFSKDQGNLRKWQALSVGVREAYGGISGTTLQAFLGAGLAPISGITSDGHNFKWTPGMGYLEVGARLRARKHIAIGATLRRYQDFLNPAASDRGFGVAGLALLFDESTLH